MPVQNFLELWSPLALLAVAFPNQLSGYCWEHSLAAAIDPRTCESCHRSDTCIRKSDNTLNRKASDNDLYSREPKRRRGDRYDMHDTVCFLARREVSIEQRCVLLIPMNPSMETHQELDAQYKATALTQVSSLRHVCRNDIVLLL